MRVIKVRNQDELGLQAAEIITEVLKRNNKATLGLATGSTPETMYGHLVKKYENGEITFQDVVTFNLDEYVGISQDDAFSYAYYMDQFLFSKVDIKKENTFIPNGLAPDLEKECMQFEQLIKTHGPIQVQILGVGLNGHIGFNEPGTSFNSRTHVAKLEASTRHANSRFFSSIDEVPHEALTMGLGTIMEAEKIVLLVQGEHKLDILKQIVYGDVTEDVPASILKNHPNALIITDLDV